MRVVSQLVRPDEQDAEELFLFATKAPSHKQFWKKTQPLSYLTTLARLAAFGRAGINTDGSHNMPYSL